MVILHSYVKLPEGTLLCGISPWALSLLFTWPFCVSSMKLSPKLLALERWVLGLRISWEQALFPASWSEWHMRDRSQTTFTNTVSVHTLWSRDSTGINAFTCICIYIYIHNIMYIYIYIYYIWPKIRWFTEFPASCWSEQNVCARCWSCCTMWVCHSVPSFGPTLCWECFVPGKTSGRPGNPRYVLWEHLYINGGLSMVRS